MSDAAPTVLCLASYEKGYDFLRECRAQGCYVILLTIESLSHLPWPREAIDEIYFMPDLHDRTAVLNAVSYLARQRVVDRIVPLDDFDLEMAATLREHLRVSGMGETTTRFFRDKLAMRMKAHESGILVPDFCHILNYDKLRDFMATVPAPWVLKPRSEASAVGIRKLSDPSELWPQLERLGDRQSHYLLERFVPGDVYHVDSIVTDSTVRFAEVCRYHRPPLAIMQGGGVFSSQTAPRESAEVQALLALNRVLLTAMGLRRGVTHTEFIRAEEDGRFYFLETAARVGGANLAEMIEAASGINLWREWAKLEIASNAGTYEVPPRRFGYAGIVVSLARQEWPDSSPFDYPEIVWRMSNKRHHIGLIVASDSERRVNALLDDAMERIARDYQATLPPPDKPTS